MNLPIKTREELDAVTLEIKRKKSIANKIYYARHYAKPEKKEVKKKNNAAYYAKNKEEIKLKRCLK